MPETLDLISDAPEVQAHYERLLRDKWTPEDAARIALGTKIRVPAVHGTDAAYFRGKGTLDKQFGSDHDLAIRVKQARKHGYNPSPNDSYEPGLAKFVGDPEAFISPSQGKNQIKRAAARLRDVPDVTPRAGLADDLAHRYTKQAIAENPSLKRMKPRELREHITDKHSGKLD